MPLTLDDLKQRDTEAAMTSIEARMRKAIDEFTASIGTCAYDRRRAVLNTLARELVNGIAGLAEGLTDESSSAVANCSEFIIDEIGVMFLDAEDKADDRKNNPSEPAYAA